MHQQAFYCKGKYRYKNKYACLTSGSKSLSVNSKNSPFLRHIISTRTFI